VESVIWDFIRWAITTLGPLIGLGLFIYAVFRILFRDDEGDDDK